MKSGNVGPVTLVDHTIKMAKSVHNRFVIEHFGVDFVFSPRLFIFRWFRRFYNRTE